MTAPRAPSESLVDLIFTALDHGLNSIDDGAGPLIPFALAEKKGKRELKRFLTERLEEGIVEARAAAIKGASAGASVAIAYDGFITLEGVRTDAIFVQAADSPRGPTYVFCGRYKVDARGKVTPIGNPAYVDCGEGLFPTPGE